MKNLILLILIVAVNYSCSKVGLCGEYVLEVVNVSGEQKYLNFYFEYDYIKNRSCPIFTPDRICIFKFDEPQIVKISEIENLEVVKTHEINVDKCHQKFLIE